MDLSAPKLIAAHRPTFWELFTPKTITVLREGYRLGDFRADVIAGLTVAIVALPLSMAIAIASGTSPERGLFTAVVGGFLICLLSGSRFQIGGPAAAFTVVVATTVNHHHHGWRVPHADGLSASRELYKVHSLSGDGRIYLRHRRHPVRWANP
jgi:SulP family sulfate permease